MPQTWTLRPLPDTNLIPSYDSGTISTGPSLRTTGKAQGMEEVCLHGNMETTQKQQVRTLAEL